jgi:hypothetical protein
MFGKKRTTICAVYDISSSSVAGAHVLIKSGDVAKTTFLAVARNDAPLQEDINIQRFVDDTVRNLEAVIIRNRKADTHHPSFIQVVLASPWYNSQTRTIVQKKEENFVCTKKMIDDLVNAEVAQMFSEEIGPFAVFGKESVVVEKQLSVIKLNGYATESPYGKKASMIELSFTVTVVSKTILDLFSDTLKRAYGIPKISFTTSPFTTFVVMRNSLPIEKECVIVDVGEEVTDVAFIKSGMVLYQHSFPIGSYGLYRALVEQGAHTPNESVALLESYRFGKLSTEATAMVKNAISAFQTKWQAGFQQILENGQYGFCIPEHMVVTADSRFEALFTEIISSDPFIKHSCVSGAIAITFMNQGVLDAMITSVDQTPLDIPLATAALFVEQLSVL